MADLAYLNEGTVFLLIPISIAGLDWLDGKLLAEDWQRLGSSIAVDRRLATDILLGAQRDGLTISQR
jgi:hypothetical protein